MNEKLEIKKNKLSKDLELIISGRIDAYWASHLESYLKDIIREGHFDIKLNMFDVKYMSSAGIRILLKFAKEFKSLNGSFQISKYSNNVKDVLQLSGLFDILTKSIDVQKSKTEIKAKSEEFEKFDFTFNIEELKKDAVLNCKLIGVPDVLNKSVISEKDINREKFSLNKYGIGIGAIGENFDDVKSRFGEFIGLGNIISYLPTDGSNKPDYFIKSGNLIPEISLLYGVIFEGKFSHFISFNNNEQKSTIKFTDILNSISEITDFETYAIAMLSETSGLVGVSINSSPTNNKDDKLFNFPEVRESVNFTTEPEFENLHTLTIGVYSKKADSKLKSFTRKISSNSEAIGHFHTAIFPYKPLKKNEKSIAEVSNSFFESGQIQSILHLLNDEREIVGTGQSEFKNGMIWVGELKV